MTLAAPHRKLMEPTGEAGNGGLLEFRRSTAVAPSSRPACRLTMTARTSSPTRHEKRATILVVDDSEDVRTLFHTALKAD